jgi:chorismate dehydratase
VSYLNTKPLLFGLEQGQMSNEVDLVLDFPANLVRLLQSNQIDMGLIPVGALPSLGKYQIISDYCIGTEGEVASVAVFSEVPMNEIDTVFLDYQSRTSVMLCKILFEKHWKKKVQFIDAKDESYIDNIRGNAAGLVIGDRALKLKDTFKFKFDLGLGWKEMTGLPFVFAVWVSVKKIDLKQEVMLNSCFHLGVTSIDEIIKRVSMNYDLSTYYHKNISYFFDAKKKEAMKAYVGMIS